MRKSPRSGEELFETLRVESDRIRVETKRFEERRLAIGAEIDRVLLKYRDGGRVTGRVITLDAEPIVHHSCGGRADHGPSDDQLDR